MLLDYIKNCNYNTIGLKDEVIFINDLTLKDIKVDTGGEAYINGITGTPLVVDCFDVSFEEQSSIDGRFLYDKTVSFSVQGYKKPDDIFGSRRMLIVVTEENEYRLVNVDFRAKMTYTYTLDKDNSYTRFSFHSYSNYPTLRVIGDFADAERYCGYGYDGADKLKMNYINSAKLDRVSGIVTTNADAFQIIEPDSYSFTEEHDGDIYVDTLTITIPISDYRSSWHYNLEEFKRNRYNAIITTKNGFNIFAGFNLGLFPEYQISASKDTESITVTLIERSNLGSVGFASVTQATKTNTQWANVDWYKNEMVYDCAGDGLAEYVLQMQVDAFGNPTGKYRCKEGMEEFFEEEYGLDIIETFQTSQTFPTAQCVESDCDLITDMPQNIIFNGVDSKTYSISSNCLWVINSVPSGLTITPTEGDGGTTYQITLENTDATERTGSFSIIYGNTIGIFTFKVTNGNFIAPTSYTINCLSQTVTFYHDENCNVTLDNENGVTYGNGNINILLPNNETTSSKTYTFVATDCNGKTQTLYVYQDGRYEQWKRVMNEYVCESGDTYELLTLFTGVTSSSTLIETSEKKRGELISGSTECTDVSDRWIFNGAYICDGDDKYELLEHQYSYDGTTWYSYGEYRIGDYVGEDSAYCSNAQYRWVITSEFICEDDI